MSFLTKPSVQRIRGVNLGLVAALLVGASCAATAQQELVTNGGFENGIDSWGYEQWSNRPLPGIIDKTDKDEGAASFKMGLTGTTGGRWIAQEVKVTDPHQNYIVSFDLKLTNVPENAARVRLGIENMGFFGGDDLVRLGGTRDWKSYKFQIPASALGAATKVTFFFYDDQMGAGTINIDNVSFKAGTLAAGEATPPAIAFGFNGPILTGDTNDPDNSTFAHGKPIELTFNGEGLPDNPLSLDLNIVDEHEQKIETKDVPVRADANGHWRTTIDAPHGKLGFYRVYAKLSNGVQLHDLGSRPTGFLTYAVVPDPANRVDYGERNSHFGMQGAWNSDICSDLGIRWVLDDRLEWRKMEPDHAGQFGPDQIKQYESQVKPGGSSFRVATLPTLFMYPDWGVVPSTAIYMTGTLTPDGEKAWANYCKAAAQAYAGLYPERKEHVYQITWEPLPPWGFKGTDRDLIRIYQIAYKALHEADPHAVVAGPCRGLYNNGDPSDTFRLLREGLGKYIDAYIAHPYYSITPEQDGMPQTIRSMKEVLQETTGKNVPMFGSEQGWTTNEDTSKEVLQAQGLLRQNLITLGEGFRFNMVFTLYDYRLSGQKGYGYYYNLIDGVPFGPSKMCPKPIGPAYAAQSMLLEGCKSDGAIEWLGDKNWGYIFERPGYRALAVWNYGSTPSSISIPTGVDQVDVFDWMGNKHVARTVHGNLTVALGPEPIYITGVSTNLWGSTAPKMLSIGAGRLTSFPDGRVAVKGSAVMPTGKPFEGSLILETDKALGIVPMTQQVSLGATDRTPFQFDLHVPATANAGSYKARLLLHDADGNTVSATAVTLDVQLPIAANAAPHFTPDGQPGTVITLQNKESHVVSGQLHFSVKELLPAAINSDLPMIDLVQAPDKSVDVEGTSKTTSFSLPSAGNQKLVISLAGASLSPTKHYEALMTITTANGTKFSQTAPIGFLGAARLTHPLKIDANLSDWPATTTIALSGPADVIRSPQSYSPSFTAQLRYAWDDKNLYIAADVKDDVFIQSNTGGDAWRQDCLQLAFNLDPHIANSSPNAGDRRTSELSVALTPSGPQIARNLSYAGDKLPMGLVPAGQYNLSIVRNGAGGLIYEMAIPWTTLGLAGGQSPKSGDAIGITATVNEVRSADQNDPCALGIFGGIYPDKDPDKQGILTLD